jgi:hypothetical protein
MWKKIITISLALVMALSLAGCAGEAEEETGSPQAQEIVNNVIEASTTVRTYQFEMDTTIAMAGEAEGETFTANMAMDFSGALDLDNRQMKMDMSMNIAMTGEDEQEIQMEMYLIDNMGYIKTTEPGMEPSWEKEEFSEADWEEIMGLLSQVESQVEFLEAAQVKIIGSEKVKGIDCYVLELTPDLAQLWQLMMQEATLGSGEGMGLPDIAEESLDEVFRNFSVKQWIAKDTYFLTKAEIDTAMELTPEAMGFPEEEGEMTMDMAMTMLMYNHNQPVSIELPPEAEEAEEANVVADANREVTNVEVAAMAYYADQSEWPTDSDALVTSEYVSYTPLYAVYTFDDYGRVNLADATPSLIGDLTWNATNHVWER